MWLDRRRTGIWPRPGGWLAQPLALLTQMATFELVDATYAYKASPDADWEKFTPLQRDLITWLEKDHG